MYKTSSRAQLQLLDDNFTPSEARDILSKFVKDQLNAYKLKGLSRWINDNESNQEIIEGKTQQLLQRKDALDKMIEAARLEDCMLSLNISIEKKTKGSLN